MGEGSGATLAALRDTAERNNGLLERPPRRPPPNSARHWNTRSRRMSSLERVLSPNSPLQAERKKALQEFGSAVRSSASWRIIWSAIRGALIRGKGPSRRDRTNFATLLICVALAVSSGCGTRPRRGSMP